MFTTRLDEMDSIPDIGPFDATKVVIPSDTAEGRRVQDDIERVLREHHYTDHEIFGIRLALEEALVNAIKHGNQLDRAKVVHIAYRVTVERFDVLVTDEGPGFDPTDVPDPTDVENLERPCGRGLMLMRHYMNQVGHNAAGNAVFMTKLRVPPPASRPEPEA